MERYLIPIIILLLLCGCASNPQEKEKPAVNDTSSTQAAANITTTSFSATTRITTTTTQVTTLPPTTALPATTTTLIPNVERNKWVIEDGVRVADAFSPAVIKLDSGKYRLFASAKEGINSYTSTDGLKYVSEKKNILSEGYDPRVYKISDNRYLMVYNNAETLAGTGDRKKLYYKSASSSDGLNFYTDMEIHLQSEVLRSPTLVSSPEILRMSNGTLRMYYTGDLFTPEIGNTNKKIKSAISPDKGATWMREDGTRIAAEALDPCAVMLPDGRIRMYYSAYDSLDSDENMSIYSAISSDGLNYTIEGKVLSPENNGTKYMDPRVIEIPGGYRMYYTEVTGPIENETTAVKSAVYITG